MADAPLGRRPRLALGLAAGSAITSSILPFMKKARSGKSSYLPSRISLKPRTFGDRDVGTRGAGELLGHVERLGEVAFQPAGPADGQLSSAESSSIPRIAMMS